MAHRTAPLVLALLVSASCGGRPAQAPSAPVPPPPPPVDDNLLALAPAAYSQVARVDLAALRASPLWGVSEFAMIDPTFAALRGASERDPLPEIDEILIVGGDPKKSGQDEILIVAKGRLDTKALSAALGASEPRADGSPDGKAALTAEALTERTIALGTPGIVAEAQALSRREGASLLENPAFSDLALAEGTAVAWRYRKSAEAIALNRLRLGPIHNLKWGEHVVTGDGSLSLASGATIEIDFALDDPAIAEKARRELKRSFSRLAGDALIRLLGISSLIDRIEIKGEKERVELRAALTAADVEEIKKMFDRIAQIRELMTEDSETDDAPLELEPPMLEHGKKP